MSCSITLAVAEAQLAAWLAASLGLTKAKQYQIDDRMLRREDSAEILKQINYWRREVCALKAAQSNRRGNVVVANFFGC